LIAKAAKKSMRRFGGVLELFSEVDIVGRPAPGADCRCYRRLCCSIPSLRSVKFHPYRLRQLLGRAHRCLDGRAGGADGALPSPAPWLSELDQGRSFEAVLSIMFQMRFLRISGHSPNLERCGICQREVDAIRPDALGVDVAKGGIACLGCLPRSTDVPHLSKGTVKQLRWVAGGIWPGRPASDSAPRQLSRRWNFSNGSCPITWGGSPAA